MSSIQPNLPVRKPTYPLSACPHGCTWKTNCRQASRLPKILPGSMCLVLHSERFISIGKLLHITQVIVNRNIRLPRFCEVSHDPLVGCKLKKYLRSAFSSFLNDRQFCLYMDTLSSSKWFLQVSLQLHDQWQSDWWMFRLNIQQPDISRKMQEVFKRGFVKSNPVSELFLEPSFLRR